MSLFELLTKLAENTHHQISIAELIKDQPSTIREAFIANQNSLLRNILGGRDINFPDRDKVVSIER